MPDIWIDRQTSDATWQRITHQLAVLLGLVTVNLVPTLACLLLVWCR